MVGRFKAEVRGQGRERDYFPIETFAIAQQVEGPRGEKHCPTAREPRVRSMVGWVWGGQNEGNPKVLAWVGGEARLVRRGRQERGRVSRNVGVGKGVGK